MIQSNFSQNRTRIYLGVVCERLAPVPREKRRDFMPTLSRIAQNARQVLRASEMFNSSMNIVWLLQSYNETKD